MLLKMAPCDVSMRENPSESLLVALVSCVLQKKKNICGKPDIANCTRCRLCFIPICFSVFLLFFSPAAPPQDILSFIFLLYLSFGCVWISSSHAGVSPPSLSNIRNANGWWGWGLSFVAKREQMLSEMLWWFPPQIRLPIPAAPPAVNTALSNPCTAWDCLSSSSCLCLWGRHYSSIGMLKAQVKGLLLHIRERGSINISERLKVENPVSVFLAWNIKRREI